MGALLRRFEEHSDDVSSVAFSPNGRQLVSGSGDETLILWDTVNGALLRRFEGHSNIVYSVAFSPDGSQIVSGSSDNTLMLWRNDRLEQLQAWRRANRYIPELTCAQRISYSVSSIWE